MEVDIDGRFLAAVYFGQVLRFQDILHSFGCLLSPRPAGSRIASSAGSPDSSAFFMEVYHSAAFPATDLRNEAGIVSEIPGGSAGRPRLPANFMWKKAPDSDTMLYIGQPAFSAAGSAGNPRKVHSGSPLTEVKRMDLLVNIITVLFLTMEATEGPIYLILNLLTLIGMMGIFRKCGLKPWHALIPCLREEKLGEAVGMEQEGRIAAMIHGAVLICREASLVVRYFSGTGTGLVPELLEVVNLFVLVLEFVYMITLHLGLCEVFDRKKSWILLWIFMESIPAAMWGWLKEFQPLWTVSEMKNDAASFFSGSKAAVLDQGLTVNLEERTATEFFKKKYLLRDIHMYIKPGHMVLLLGGSGAGKTTYLNAVNGYEKAKSTRTCSTISASLPSRT